ncbi:dehydrodolichyl diphosphate synthase complex subunit nus1 [Neodiprion lecontei]|uniref:ditrans,polycis-polyprenyl diphosphate synthase [(2E,6E)-farnesyldiphosphate specific] n=1 Tax=Neodiprion lecontei TaxID=441921 RepID=A0A6J0CCN4_NEOLC|nr:dehydrodolichyl diphosphate synthase complex subunit nus1 [Neodiprion lecontei]
MFVKFYRALLTLLHISYAFITLLRKAWTDAAQLELFNLSRSKVLTDADYLVRCVRRVDQTRLPKHLVLILGRERASLRDIVRVIAWSATAGIPCVSFYDYDGILRKNEEEARRALAKFKPELVDHVNWNSTCPVKAVKNGLNGVKHKLQVQLLSYTDGKREVALLTQSLGKGVITGALKLEEINSDLLENKLELGGLPDPDLAVVCGKTCSTYGLLPWHIRTTEFLLLESHHNIRVNDFVNLLEKYAKCEQRYGK